MTRQRGQRLRSVVGLRSLSVVCLGLLVVALPVIVAYQASLIAPTTHLDGAFQTASALFRLEGGQIPGKDFFPYLGIGPNLALLPVFLLLGGDLAASVFASWFLSLLALEVGFALLAVLVFRKRSLLLAAAVAPWPVLLVLVLVKWPQLTDVLSQVDGFRALLALAEPGASLRPIRSFAPYLIALVAFAVMGRGRASRVQVFGLGIVTGSIAAVWSNDFGLTSAGLMLILVSGWALMRPRWQVSKFLVLWGSSLLSFVVVGMIATGGYFLSYLSFNWSDVRGDQFWYFGPWRASRHVFSLGDLFSVLGRAGIVFLLLLVVVAVWAVVKRDSHRGLLAYLGGALFLGGLVASVGGHVGNYYFWPFRLWGLMVTALLLAKLVVFAGQYALRSAPESTRLRWWRISVVAGVATTLVVGSFAGWRGVQLDLRTRDLLTRSPNFTYEPALGSYLNNKYAAHLRLAATDPGVTIEEYGGLWNVLNGSQDELAVDSVIHALGSQRARFESEIEKLRPEYFVTTYPSTWIEEEPSVEDLEGPGLDDGWLDPDASDLSTAKWVNWNLSANWWFYRDLFRSYVPSRTSPKTLLWTRAQPATWSPVACSVENKPRRVVVGTDEPGMYEVTLEYQGPGKNSRSFTMVQNNINEFARGYVALDPAATEQQFPMYTDSKDETRLKVRDIPKTKGQHVTKLLGCTAARIAVPEGAVTLDLYVPTFYLSRFNWKFYEH